MRDNDLIECIQKDKARKIISDYDEETASNIHSASCNRRRQVENWN